MTVSLTQPRSSPASASASIAPGDLDSPVRRAAETNRAWPILSLREEYLYIEIEDRGVGFDADFARSEPSLGLTGMQERMARLGGELRVTSTHGNGTRVRAEIPFPVSERTPTLPAR